MLTPKCATSPGRESFATRSALALQDRPPFAFRDGIADGRFFVGALEKEDGDGDALYLSIAGVLYPRRRRRRRHRIIERLCEDARTLPVQTSLGRPKETPFACEQTHRAASCRGAAAPRGTPEWSAECVRDSVCAARAGHDISGL